MCMEYSIHTCVPVWVLLVGGHTVFAWAQYHHVCVGPWIDNVLIASSIVSSVIDAHRLVSVNTPIHNADPVALRLGERVFPAFEILLEYPREKVVVQIRYKFLPNHVSIEDTGIQQVLT